jgi:hypothetical protein
MTNAELDALVATLRQATPLKRLTEGAARAVILQLLAKGYDLVKQHPGGRFIETDGEAHDLTRWLQDKTPLGSLAYPEAKNVFDTINGMGLRIRKPDRHPSGLATREMAHVDVKPLDRGFAGSQSTISKGAPVGPVAVFNGGES